jgi:ADP-ribosylglycohydrolase
MDVGDPTLRDRVAGVLVGLAVGDALGAPYEFQIPGPREPQMVGGGIGPWEPGEWTDDTQQAICIAQAAAGRRLDPLAVGERLLEWFRAGPKDVGVHTRRVLSQARSGAELADIAADVHALRPGNSAGNGSLMRTAPVALAHLGHDAAIARQARAISSLTHADPLCGDACVLWCIAIDRAVREERLNGIDEGLSLLPGSTRNRWAHWIAEARRDPPARFVPNGFVVTALQTALAAIEHTARAATDAEHHVRLALRTAIATGHDTDTVGAITGALVGARWGARAFPTGWVEPLHGWPGLDAAGLEALALSVAGIT